MVTCELVQLATQTTHAICNQTDPRRPAHPRHHAAGRVLPAQLQRTRARAGLARRVQRGKTHLRCRRTGPAQSKREPKLAVTCRFSCTTLCPTVPLAPGGGGGLRTCRRKPGPRLLPAVPVPEGCLRNREGGTKKKSGAHRDLKREQGPRRRSCSKSTTGEGSRGQADIPQPACRCLTR